MNLPPPLQTIALRAQEQARALGLWLRTHVLPRAADVAAHVPSLFPATPNGDETHFLPNFCRGR